MIAPVCALPQTAAVDAAHAERDAYKLSAQELQERSKVGLEGAHVPWLVVRRPTLWSRMCMGVCGLL